MRKLWMSGLVIAVALIATGSRLPAQTKATVFQNLSTRGERNLVDEMTPVTKIDELLAGVRLMARGQIGRAHV